MSERYLEDFEAGQTFRSGRIRIDGVRDGKIANDYELWDRDAEAAAFGSTARN